MSLSSVETALNLGTALVGSILTVIPQGNIGGIDIQATLRETADDTLELTDQPVQTGASITDHSFVRPAQLVMECGWSNASDEALLAAVTSVLTSGSLLVSDYVSGIYSQLIQLQHSRQPFAVSTTIRLYPSMMLTSLALTRDAKTSQALMVRATMREVFFASTSSTTLPPQSAQANPEGSAETQNVGSTAPVSSSPNPGGSLPPSQWIPD